MIRYQIEERIKGGAWQVSPGSVVDETYETREEAERAVRTIRRDYAVADDSTSVELRVVEVSS